MDTLSSGLNYEEDMKRLEELKKQFELSKALPSTPQLTPVDDKEALLQKHRESVMNDIRGQPDRQAAYNAAYEESQKAGEGFSGGASRGLAVLSDTFAGMAGQKGGATQDVVKNYMDQRKQGAEVYKASLSKENDLMEKLDKLDSREAQAYKIKNLKESTDPKSAESQAARLFAKESLGLTLPETTNAIQAKTFMDQYIKSENFKSDAKWKEKNYDQKERESLSSKENKRDAATRTAAKDMSEEKWKKMNYDQRERAREATKLEKEAAVKRSTEEKSKLSPTETLKVSEGKAIPDTLDDIAKTLEDKKELFASTSFKPWAEASAYLRKGTKEDEQIVESKLSSASQQFGRYMEGGVLRREDEIKYRSMFPGLQDTPEVARGKLSNIREMMQRKQQTDLDALKAQGKSTAGLEFNTTPSKSSSGNAPWLTGGK